MEPAAPHLDGHRLGPYQIEARLGAGGMGEVYRARDTRLDRTVAIKVLPPSLAGDRPARDRLEREARAVAALNHPNICTLHDIGEGAGPGPTGGEPIRFLVMEFVEGSTLDLVGELPLEPSRVAHIAAQVCDGLDAAHARGIVHRDLKPLNLMVTPRGQVKILDFGIAKLDSAADGGASAAMSAVQTGTGLVLGTLQYMSPEQLAGDRLSAASDIFSLGLVLYRLLTGRHPFAPDEPYAQVAVLLHNILLHTPNAPHHYQPGVPPALEAVVLRMLDRDPRARPSAAEIRQVMLDPETIAGASAAPSVERSHPHTVGRQRERALLDQAFDDADAGRPALVAISGEPGIGKTTLVEEFLGRVRSTGRAYVARGRCSERLVGSEAYLPVLEMLESLLVGDDRHSGAQLMMSRAAPTWYAQVAGRTPSSGVGGQLELRTASQERMKRELRAFLAEASQVKPLVLFLDDLHWSDVSTIDLLGYLCSQFGSMRLLIVATYRPTDLLLAKHPFAQLKLELSARGVCRELPIGFLSRQEAEHYLALEFPGHTFPPEFAFVVHEKTEGSPLFLVNLVRDFRERQVIVQSESGWRLAQSVPAIERDLPESVRSMIERKIAQLADEDRQLLVAASVQGHAFDSAVVAHVLGRDPATVEERLEVLDRVHAFVQVVGEEALPDGTPTLRCRFVHVLYQNALFASLRATRRASLSNAVADALIAFHRERHTVLASELAVLFETARDRAKAAHYLLLASQNALRVFAFVETAAIAERAVSLLKNLPESRERNATELKLQIALGTAWVAIKGYAAPDVERAYGRARELCRLLDDSAELASVLFGLFVYYVVVPSHTTSLELGDEMLGIAERERSTALRVQGLLMHGMTQFWRGRPSIGDRQLEEAIALQGSQRSTTPGTTPLFDHGIWSRRYHAASLWLLGYPDRALREAETALVEARQAKNPLTVASTLTFVSMVHQFRREVGDAARTAAEAVACTREYVITYWYGFANALHGWTLAMAPDPAGGIAQWDGGVAKIKESLDAHRQAGARTFGSLGRGLLAEAYVLRGLWTEARETIDEGLALAAETDEGLWEAELHRLGGAALVAQGFFDDAAQEFERAILVARERDQRSLELRALTSLYRLAGLQRDSAVARDTRTRLAQAYEWFSEGFETADLRDARALLDAR